MPLVAVAVLRVIKSQFEPNARNRVEEFGIAVRQACSLLDDELGAAAAIRMIIAPEYYFNPRNDYRGLNVPEAVSHKAKRGLYDNLAAISLSANNTIIVAGSLLYSKRKGGMFQRQTQGLNVCPIFLNGNILYEYYKVSDDGALGRVTPGAAYRHKSTAPFFSHGGVNFGIEICMDHVAHILQDWLAAQHAAPLIDIHILISDGSGVARGNVAAWDGGYIIHCDLGGEADLSVQVLGFDSTTAPPPAYPGEPGWNRAQLLQPDRANATQLNGVRTEVFRLNV